VPSLQVEIDRVRVKRLALAGTSLLDAPLHIGERVHLSTGAPLKLDESLTLFYVAEPACRYCSSDLETLKKSAPPGARLLMVPDVPDEDSALRRVVRLYHYNWPIVLGLGGADALAVRPPALVVAARRGWSAAAVESPLPASLPTVLEVFARNDVAEDVPRPAWNHRPAEHKPLPKPPVLLEDGLAPGEDEPAPSEFTAAVEAYRHGHAADAIRLFEQLEARGDGWLLAPEGRLDRGLCMMALGRREEARRLLLRTGDSRFQDAVDRALEGGGKH
jgi:hypothetical protein